MDPVLQAILDAGIRYVVIGGQAVRLSGADRFALDWDFYIPADDSGNLDRINELLASHFCEPVLPTGPEGENCVQAFQSGEDWIQFHLQVPGMPAFEIVEESAIERRTTDGTPVRCACIRHLLASKLAADRPEDQADIEFLMEQSRVVPET